MEKGKFAELVECVRQGYDSVVQEMLEFTFEACEDSINLGDDRISIVVGMTGKNSGRILFEMNRTLAETIAQRVNCDRLDDPMELYQCLSEFANRFCGDAVARINDRFSGTELRPTPPAVFAGKGMGISTPNITSAIFYIQSAHGAAFIDIGFEGE